VNSKFKIQAAYWQDGYSTPVVFWLLAFSFQLTACGQSTNQSTKFQQYYVQGEQLYLKNCSNCHQKKGGGLGRIYPPVNKSDYIDQNPIAVLCLMKYGKEGEILVNGKTYNKPMKGITSLTSLEIAEIATYLYNTWGRERGIVEISEVNKALTSCEEKF
jgi:cytochrome c551